MVKKCIQWRMPGAASNRLVCAVMCVSVCLCVCVSVCLCVCVCVCE